MARQILQTLDLRTSAQREGITKRQQTMQAIANILKTVGQAEKDRREGQQLDRVARAIAGGATTPEAILAVANQPPEFGTGITGALQKFGGAFQPSSGGMGQGIQQAIIGQALQQALTRPEPFTLSAGAQRFTGAGEQIAAVPPTPRGPLVTVQTGDIEKSTRGQIEKDVIELQATLTELETIEKEFDEDFFTFRGKGRAFFTDLAAQLEIPTSQAQKDFLTRKTKFFADSKRVFLKFRKFITGVAGGIEEFKEIAKATIDPEKGSGIAFKAKFDSMRDNAIRTQNVLLAIRNSGLDPDNKAIQEQIFRGLPLKSIPIDVPGNVTLESLLQPKQETEQERIELPEDLSSISPDDLTNMSLDDLKQLRENIDKQPATKPVEAPNKPIETKTPDNIDKIVNKQPEPKTENEFRSALSHISNKEVAIGYYKKWKSIFGVTDKFEDIWKPIGG